MNIQSVLFPKDNICNVEELYFHREGDCVLFDGYFNLFYLEKHHKYCDIRDLTLELEVKGLRKLVLMHNDSEVKEEMFENRPISGRERIRAFKENRVIIEKDTATLLQKVSITVPYDKCKLGVIWFKVQVDPRFADGSWILRGNYECAPVDEHVKIGVNICTFKREKYVLRNMKSLTSWAEEHEDVAQKLHVFIVDNGNTLSSDEEFQKVINKTDYIEVIPNANTGGTGGFSRGMTKAMEKRDELLLSHLLMMDDDAVFDPDLFIRLHGFLSLLRPEYKEITVGGALMREDFKYVQHAAGEWFTKFMVINDHPLVDMRDYRNCTAEWMTDASEVKDRYGAWWCCCYNMSAITGENLPLPIFVHHDDIQFGMKQAERGIVFLNGICVWHQGFELVFPGVKQYYNMRNTMITMNMFEPEYFKKNWKYWAIRRYTGVMINYRYGECDLIYRAIVDYTKGREWLLSSDPEALHKEVTSEYKAAGDFVSLENVEFDPEERTDVLNQVDEISDFKNVDELREYYNHDKYSGPVLKELTVNGYFLPGLKRIKVITPLDSPWECYRRRKVLLYEPGSGKGLIVNRSYKELFKGIGRIIRICFMKTV